MRIADDCVVFINYKLTDGDGNLLDQSPEGEPLAYVHGAAGIVPGLEEVLVGKSAGETFDVTLDPDDAYGDHMPEAVQDVPLSQFPADIEIAVGMQFADESSGSPIPATVVEVGPESIKMDTNHPLAGLTLRFEGSVVEVREATEEELEDSRSM